MEKNIKGEVSKAHDVILTKKKGHKESVTSSCIYSRESDTQFFTGSEDKTVRLWDLRAGGSVKMFSNPEIEDEITSVCYDNENGNLYISSENKIISFDERKCKIICNEFKNSFKNSNTEDEIPKILIENSSHNLIFIDDSGSLTMLSPELKPVSKIGEVHSAIPYSLALRSTSRGILVYSGGFDCCLKESSFDEVKVQNSCNVNDALASVLGLRLMTPAHIYHIEANEEKVVMSLETGHILSFEESEEGEMGFDFLIDGHANRIIQTKFSSFDPEKLVSISADMSWAMWDLETQKIVKKIKLEDEPNSLLTLKSNKLIVTDVSPSIKIFELKP